MRLTHHSNSLRAIQSLLLLLPLACGSAQASTPVKSPCPDVAWASLKKLPSSDWQEIPASKYGIAANLLTGNVFARITNNDVEALTNIKERFRNKMGYLFKARYSNGGFGQFDVSSDGNWIMSQFRPLGRRDPQEHETFLVLGLSKPPRCSMVSAQPEE